MRMTPLFLFFMGWNYEEGKERATLGTLGWSLEWWNYLDDAGFDLFGWIEWNIGYDRSIYDNLWIF